MPDPSPTPSRGELPIIQATMDLIPWFVPLLNRLPRDHRYEHGARLVEEMGRQLGGWISQQRLQGQAAASGLSLPGWPSPHPARRLPQGEQGQALPPRCARLCRQLGG
jgi:hypothetical protein